jgi:hypothetical protein
MRSREVRQPTRCPELTSGGSILNCLVTGEPSPPAKGLPCPEHVLPLREEASWLSQHACSGASYQLCWSRNRHGGIRLRNKPPGDIRCGGSSLRASFCQPVHGFCWLLASWVGVSSGDGQHVVRPRKTSSQPSSQTGGRWRTSADRRRRSTTTSRPRPTRNEQVGTVEPRVASRRVV